MRVASVSGRRPRLAGATVTKAPLRYAITMVATDCGLGIADIARAVEERGLDGLWVPDHTHIPVSRQTPYPLGGDLPERYLHLLDPLTSLAMAAAVTSRIRVGTGVLLAAQRDPIVTAKALATIDQQSDGRLAVGVGYGWNVEEMRDHGVDPATRRARLRDHVLAMRRLWEEEVASFRGEHVTFAPSWSWPKPVQRPLPVLVGGAANPTVFAHIAEFGQGWVPAGGRPLADGVPRLCEVAAEAGRRPDDLEIIPFVTAAQAGHRRIDALERAGATEIAFDILPGDGKTVRGELDRLARLIADRRSLPPPGEAVAFRPRSLPYLVKLPASTVIVRPVTYFDSSEARNSTALAMSSGCTSGVGSRCSDWKPGATCSQVGFSTPGAKSA
jgi:probable F420-dependent oxidoreductase